MIRSAISNVSSALGCCNAIENRTASDAARGIRSSRYSASTSTGSWTGHWMDSSGPRATSTAIWLSVASRFLIWVPWLSRSFAGSSAIATIPSIRRSDSARNVRFGRAVPRKTWLSSSEPKSSSGSTVLPWSRIRSRSGFSPVRMPTTSPAPCALEESVSRKNRDFGSLRPSPVTSPTR